MRRRVILHPVLFAILPVLFLYTHNTGQLRLGELLIPTALAAAAGLSSWLLLGLVLRDREQAAVVASLFWVWFFSYGHVALLAVTLPVTRSLDWEHHRFFMAYGLLGAGAAAFLILRRGNWRSVTSTLNVIAVVLVAWHGLRVGGYEVKRLLADRSGPGAELAAAAREGRAGSRPNIYFIVLDGYARADVLADLYDYDNSEFLDYLRGKGFFVADRGRANYCQTLLSLGSCLSLDYLDDLAERMGPDSEGRLPLMRMVERGRLRRLLEQQGYRTVAFSSGYDPTEVGTADLCLGPAVGFSQFQSMLLNTTPLRADRMSRLLFEIDEAEAHRRRVLYACQHLADTAALEPPVFVFAHIVCPHPPFVFDRHGNPAALVQPYSIDDGMTIASPREYVAGYTEQVIFINRQMRAALDRLLDASRYPAVIILQADHGPGSRLDWESADRTDLRERFATLSAYYLGGARDVPWRHDVSAVNMFRIVLNRYFGTDLPLLPNECYFSSMSRPYRFVRVTDAVNANPREPKPE